MMKSGKREIGWMEKDKEKVEVKNVKKNNLKSNVDTKCDALQRVTGLL